MRCEWDRTGNHYLILVGMVEKVFAVWFPCDDICKPRTQLGIFFVTGNLASFEPETRINAKTLVIKVPGVRATLLFGSQRAVNVCLRYPIPVGHCQ